MIAFGCVTTSDDDFRSGAMPAMQAVIEGDSLLMRRHLPKSIAAAYNEMLDQAASDDSLEAVVLIDQDTTISLDGFMAKVRAKVGLGDDVAIVDAADGTLLVLSSWAARELRFDVERAVSLDDCAADICAKARSHGRRVLLASDIGASRPAAIPPTSG